jgi:glycerol-3-phosphate dehydrogenase
MELFSALLRKDYIQKLESETFDLLIVGGGITGAGIALDAVSRGLKVALVEKKDFAWGTSSRSTKLIHGGLRYLKQFEIALVREVGLERAIVYHNARHVVRPEKMLLPIVEKGSLGKTMSSLGLWVYDYLADVKKSEKRRMLTKEDTANKEPLLRTDVLKGGGLYYEYRSDDARLTIENIKTAHKKGAVCLNYTEVVDYVEDDEQQICGVKVVEHISNKKISIKAKVVVNATGPWVDELRRIGNGEVKGKRLHLTKGIHVVVPRKRLPLQQSAYFDVEGDDRMLFAIPRGNVTYIGTTDTTYKEKISNPVANIEDINYVLNATNFMFPSCKLSQDDVISTWAGLRPLIHEDGKDPSELSRKDEIFYAKNGLISIAGGKLTGYRKMAERTLDVVLEKLVDKYPNNYDHIQACTTEHTPLNGNFGSEKELEEFIIARSGEVTQIQLSQEDVSSLVFKYGRDTDIIIEKAFELYTTISDPQKRIHTAELWYSIEHEMSNNLCDYLIRRSGRLYFERPSLQNLYPALLESMADIFKWDISIKEKYAKEFESEFLEVLSFKEIVV